MYRNKIKKGISISVILGIISYYINNQLNEFGIFSPGSGTIAFILGVLAAAFISDLNFGGKYNIEKLLPISIIFLGFGLNLGILLNPDIGLLGLLVILTSAIVSFLSCIFFGRLFNLNFESSIALGAGGAICGNSAVLAVSPSLKIKEDQVAIIIAAINILGVFSFILIPIFSNLMNLTQEDAGIWIGSVMHAVPQTIAAGEAIGSDALIIATLLKLSRVSLLILVVPICVIIGKRNNEIELKDKSKGKIPYFVPGFVVSSILCTFFIPANFSENMYLIGKLLLIPVMVSVGFFINLGSFKNSYSSVLYVGIISTIMMSITTFLVINLF